MLIKQKQYIENVRVDGLTKLQTLLSSTLNMEATHSLYFCHITRSHIPQDSNLL